MFCSEPNGHCLHQCLQFRTLPLRNYATGCSENRLDPWKNDGHHLLRVYGGLRQYDLVYGKFILTVAASVMFEYRNCSWFHQPEACLTIKPYMEVLTLSEMHAVLTGGFATIACNVFVAYVRLGVRPNYLLLASALSPPASLAFSKLFYPETEASKTRAWNIFTFKG